MADLSKLSGGNGQKLARGPVCGVKSLTQSDGTDDASGPFRALYVGATGNVKLTTVDGDDVTLTAMAGGVWHPIAFTRVWSTGTTATGLLGGI